MTVLQLNEAAFAAASDAADVVPELIRYGREGNFIASAAFGTPDVINKLAGALRIAVHIEETSDFLDDADREALTDLGEVLDSFIERWVG